MPSLDSSRLEGDLYGEEDDGSALASMLGGDIVTQVLEQACTIVTASKRIGWPWKCIKVIYDDLQECKEMRPPRNCSEILLGNITAVEKENEAKNIGATSTPQKGVIAKNSDNIVVGQGDEQIDANENKLSKSTLRFINYLFDTGEGGVSNKDDQIVIGNFDNKLGFAEIYDNTHNQTEEMTKDDNKDNNDVHTTVMCDIIEKLFNRIMDVTTENDDDDDIVGNEIVDVITNETVDVVTNETVDVVSNETVDVVSNETVDVVSNETVEVVSNETVDVSEDENVNVAEVEETKNIFDELEDYKKNSEYHPFYNADGLDAATEKALINGVEQQVCYMQEDDSDTEYELFVPPTEEILMKSKRTIIMSQGSYNIQAEGDDVVYETENPYEGDIFDQPLFEFDPEVVETPIPVGTYTLSHSSLSQQKHSSEDEEKRSDVARYENAYLTLNRDYEQCSEEEEQEGVLDPKAMNMQDVELSAGSAAEEEYHYEEGDGRKELAAISAVSGASGSRKSRTSIMSRCKTQGAKLLSCLRGWWRRKTPGKRKDARTTGSIQGVCPLSPDGRRRAASLLDNSTMYSPTSRRTVIWKFNTVNEAVVSSSRWKDYTFEVKPDSCGEHCC